MKYKIVTASTIAQLEVKIEEAISQGWRPQGGVSVNETDSVYHQAMTIYL